MKPMFSSVERERSVSSMRRMKAPPWWRAKSQLKSAVRAPPTCRWPVGLGAKRTLTASVISVLLEQTAPRRGRELADARAAYRRVPEVVVIDVRGERRPDHQRGVQQQTLERPQRAATDELVAPDHQAAAGLEAHVQPGRVGVAHNLDLARVGHAEAALVAHLQVRDRERVEAHDLRRDG